MHTHSRDDCKCRTKLSHSRCAQRSTVFIRPALTTRGLAGAPFARSTTVCH